MEVSSHALDQHRVYGVTFGAAVFTNFTRDHLDYHGTMEEYFAAKAKLIDYLAPDGCAVINADDRAWDALPRAPRTLTYGLGHGDVRAEGVTFSERGSTWTLAYESHRATIQLPLIGDFNVVNALSAAAAALAMGDAFDAVAEALARVPQIPGRLEVIATSPTVIRDYAHTPDALVRSLAALRPFVRGRLIAVFGAGGDRDPGKRPLMGEAAEQGADVVIVTSDNPRTERPDAIIDDIERGMRTPHERITDRREAIARAVAIARDGDVVLLAGKGHETYQVLGTEKVPFDEREVVAEILERRA
jgi:UDP-N-acetylmuramoyl-L-alanyl-D-glutamate--2,6-diaminopimelate ligase